MSKLQKHYQCLGPYYESKSVVPVDFEQKVYCCRYRPGATCIRYDDLCNFREDWLKAGNTCHALKMSIQVSDE